MVCCVWEWLGGGSIGNCELVNDPLQTTFNLCLCCSMYSYNAYGRIQTCNMLPCLCSLGGGGGGAVAHAITYIHFLLHNLVALQLNSYVDSPPKAFVESILRPLCVCRKPRS